MQRTNFKIKQSILPGGPNLTQPLSSKELNVITAYLIEKIKESKGWQLPLNRRHCNNYGKGGVSVKGEGVSLQLL